ncbi:MAG: transketolase C-terminal domain-containing protein [Clostridia bacterium]
MENVEMRKVFATQLRELMLKDDKVMVLDADLAKASGTHGLRTEFPDRAIEVGIAEQNMVSVAAGLSSYGYKPFVTTFSPFASRRVCDQITLSVCYAKQNVKIVGTDPGISAELNGGTHMGMEDIAVLRGIPNIVIFEPVDNTQLALAMPIINDYYGAVYIRMFRKCLTPVFDENYKFDLFKADVIKEGKDISIFCSGIMVQETLLAQDMLKEAGIDAEIINVHTIKPIDEATIIASVKKTGCAVSCENHNIVGGLYSAISEVLCAKCPTPMLAIGVPNTFGEVGKLPYLKQIYKMRAQDIVEQCKKAIALKK